LYFNPTFAELFCMFEDLNTRTIICAQYHRLVGIVLLSGVTTGGGLEAPLCGKCDFIIILLRLYEYYKTYTSFILFSTFRLILNAFN